MYLDLTEVLQGAGATLERPIRIAPTTLGDLEIVEPVEGIVRVENARRNLVVSGHANAVIELPCARCLKPSAQALELEFEAVAPLRLFGPAGFTTTHAASHHAGREDEYSEEDEADDELAALFEDHSLDVLELVRQAIELQAPIKPLCQPDCPGLPEAEKYLGGHEKAHWNALENWNSGNANGSAAP